jgi:Flp pilus assembly protein TadG
MASLIAHIGRNLSRFAGQNRTLPAIGSAFAMQESGPTVASGRIGDGKTAISAPDGLSHNQGGPRGPARHNRGSLRHSIARRHEAAKGRGGLLGRFLRSRSGVTIVEFALVGPLFLLLVFAIFDNGLVLFTQTILDNATREAARQIRIGKVQISGDTTGTGLFKTTLCNNVAGLIPCGSLEWYVQSVNSSGSFSTMTAATASATSHLSSTGFTPGGPQYFVLVQVGYTMPYFMPVFARMTGATGKMLLQSNVAFQSEHYQ